MLVSVQFMSRLGSDMLWGMPRGPFAVAPCPRPLHEGWHFLEGINLGFDGGLLPDFARVFVVPRYRHSREHVILDIFYCDDFVDNMPIAWILDHEPELHYPVIALVSSFGFVGKCVIHIQRRWRRWLRAKRYGKSMVEFGLLLANVWCRGRKLPDQIGPCQRKRKRSDPSRGGGEPSYQSQRRN